MRISNPHIFLDCVDFPTFQVGNTGVLLRYVHTMPRGTQRQSVARPRNKSRAMPQVYVDTASAWLRHAV